MGWEEADSAIRKAALVTRYVPRRRLVESIFFSVFFYYEWVEFTRLSELAIRTILAGILGKSEPSNIYLEVLLGICSHRNKK